ncbi:BamA/TamA family outer membrane protein [Sphingomonas fennica]|nr:BamA/TamA family outer membrane protein [Sphingomonas fennica]
MPGIRPEVTMGTRCTICSRLVAIAGLALLWAAPARAYPPDEPVKEMSENAKAAGAMAGGHDLLVVPIPLSNPTLGSGLTLAGVMFYNPNQSPEPWITGVGVMKTSNGSWGAGAFHSMSLDHDRFRITGFAGYGNANIKFYGIGPHAGDRGVSVKLDEKGAGAMLQAQMRIVKNVYIGPRYQFLDLKTTIKNPNPIFPDLNIPPFEADSKLSQIGPVLTYDRRDNSLNPRNGELFNIQWMFNVKALGSDFSSDKITIAGNVYRPLSKTTVLALHASVCGASKGTPFYDLCLYGMNNDLRGYEAGRYRDGATWAAQAEIRQHLFWRIGAVVFGGVGGVSPSLGHLTDTKFLPAGGGGLRFQPSRKTNVNLRLDFAVGKHSNALYFSIAEAF